MNEQSDSDEQKAQFVDSLLNSLYQNSSAKAQSLVTAGLDRLDTNAKSEIPTKQTAPRWPRWRVLSLATAALILIAALIPNFTGQRNKALAAVTNSLRQSLVDTGRRYTLESTWRNQKVEDSLPITGNAELYVRGSERLAIRINVPFGSSTWLGLDSESAWVVPPVGPVIVGNEDGLNKWAASSEELSTPFLHVSTMLERMKDSYELEFAPDVTLQVKGQDVLCQHVVGKQKADDSSFPSQIDLWADFETGVAMKMVATWKPDPSALISRESLRIDFEENIELKESFFSPDNHGGKGRLRIRFGSKQPNE